MAKEQLVTADQVQQHGEAENRWVAIDGQVWDMAEFAPEHPNSAAGKTDSRTSILHTPAGLQPAIGIAIAIAIAAAGRSIGGLMGALK